MSDGIGNRSDIVSSSNETKNAEQVTTAEVEKQPLLRSPLQPFLRQKRTIPQMPSKSQKAAEAAASLSPLQPSEILASSAVGPSTVTESSSNPLVSTETTPKFTPFTNTEMEESKYDNSVNTPVNTVNKQGIKVVSAKTKKEYTVYITGDTIDIVDNENKTHTMKRIRSQQGGFKKNKRPTKKSKRIQ